MQKILIIRFSSIGDIVLTSPIIRAVSTQLSAEVHYLTKAEFAPLVKYNPHIKKVFCWSKSESEKIVSELIVESYDIIIDLHKNLRTRRIRQRLGVKSYDFQKLNIEKWLMVNFKWNKLPEKHLVDRYFDGLRFMGIKNDNLGLEYFLRPEERNVLELLTNTFVPENYYCIALGAAHFTKQIPYEKLIQICKDLEGKIVLLGGKKEKDLGEKIQGLFPDKVYNAAGKTDLNESAQIINSCKLLISPDTGMMHIAAALKKPILAIWGNTIPEFGMYPYFPKGEEKYVNIEVKNLSCRPCSKIGKKKCPKGHFNCMNKISSSEIIAEIANLKS